MNTMNTPVTTATAIPSFAMEQEQGTFTFFDYDAKQEYPAPEGARLITCLYRAKGGKDAARPNQAMFIPDWISEQVVTDNLPRLMEYFVTYLQDQEQEMLRGKHKDCSTMIGSSQFSLEALLEYMTSKGAGSRLSGELIAKWFTDSGLAQALTELYMERTGSEHKAGQLVEFINKKLQSLASPKTSWNDEEKAKLLPILESAEDSSIKAKLLARVHNMASVTESLLDAL